MKSTAVSLCRTLLSPEGTDVEAAKVVQLVRDQGY